MAKKQFKAESKRLLDLMINSIYTNKEIFLRELISNASDAIDKVYFRSLTDKKLSDVKQSDLKINVIRDKENRILTIKDNGIGMTEEELEKNLGTIAQSGTLSFKQTLINDDKDNDKNKKSEETKEADDKSENKMSLIGQFGVGFYSCFMVADEVTVISKSADSEKAYKWVSSGADGYTIEEAQKEDRGTEIIIKLKKNTDDENYSKYVEEYVLENLIKKYSDYIRYPIIMNCEKKVPKPKAEGDENAKQEYDTVEEDKTINSMIPLWKKAKKDIKDEEYKNFYMQKFYDFEEPLKWIHTKVEGQYSYSTLLYIPSHVPYDYYGKEFKKGLQLYSNGVLIMEHCEDLLPDYFGFVKGLVDSEDLSLNISREILQQDKQLKVIAKNIESKIRSELENMLNTDRIAYEKLFKAFGMPLKIGAYDGFGLNKDKLKDLLLFHSSHENEIPYKEDESNNNAENKESEKKENYKSDYTTFKEYVSRMKPDQKEIYYASSESVDKIKMMPQVESVIDKGFEVLFLDESVDEFVLQMMQEYDGKKFANVSANDINLDTDEEKEALKKLNEESKDLFKFMKESLNDENIKDIRFTHRLKNHPVCLSSEGVVSVEMQKVLNAMPDQNNQNIKAQTVLEVNEKHPIAEKLKALYKEDNKEELKKYTKVLLDAAKLIEGLPIDNPTELSNLICEFMTK
ncbi:MAG: molecular chaperone HtpG [Clostridia bacterium]|nr:molecular chaperone HtpG [Clostridia bacterium]